MPKMPRPIVDGLNFTTADQIRPKRVPWFWRHWLPGGFVGLLGGHPGIGKSTVLVDLAARISRGEVMPDDSAGPEAGMVMLLSGEDSHEHTVIPRLMAAEANLKNVIVEAQVGVPTVSDDDEQHLEAEPFNFEAHRDLLEEAMTEHPIQLVILDPLTLFIGDNDRKSYSKVYAAMLPLIEFAARHEVAVIGNTHLNKGKDMTAMQRIMDSTGLVAAPRFLWMAAQDKDGYSMLWVEKSNLGPKPPGLHFEIEPVEVSLPPTKKRPQETFETTRVKWLGEADRQGGEIIESEGRPKREREEVKDYLLRVLKDGAVLAKEVQKGTTISKRTLDTAKVELGIRSFRKVFQGPSYWKLPD